MKRNRIPIKKSLFFRAHNTRVLNVQSWKNTVNCQQQQLLEGRERNKIIKSFLIQLGIVLPKIHISNVSPNNRDYVLKYLVEEHSS